MDFNLFPIGATGFEANTNPLALPVADKDQAKSKGLFDFSLPSLPSFSFPGQGKLSDIYDFFDKLTDASTWQRGGLVIIGVLILVVGLYLLGSRPVVNVVSAVRG